MGKGYNYFDIEAEIEERNYINAEPQRKAIEEQKRQEEEERLRREAEIEEEARELYEDEREERRVAEEDISEQEARRKDPFIMYRVTEGSMYEARKQEGDLPLLELAKQNAKKIKDEEESE